MTNFKNLPYILSALSGLLLFSGWADVYPWPLMFVAFLPMLFVEHYVSVKEGKAAFFEVFKYAYLAFGIWNGLVTWWAYKATVWGVLIPVFLNGAFLAMVFGLFHVVKQRLGRAYGYFSFIMFWLAFEQIHYSWALSFPYLNLGNGLAKSTEYIQWYAQTGVLGGSAWVLFTNVLLFQTALYYFRKETLKGTLLKPILAVVIALFLVIVSLRNTHTETGSSINVVVLQPNIDPFTEKFSGMTENEQISRIVNLVYSTADSTTDLILAPETAIPNPLWLNKPESSPAFRELNQMLSRFPGATLVIGGYTYLPTPESGAFSRKLNDSLYVNQHNSALCLRNGAEMEMYHKSRLVLGTETMPFADIFTLMQKLELDIGGISGSFTPQNEAENFTFGKTVLAPIVCYESIYGDYTSRFVSQGANLLAVITNDGWWGNTAGHRQHLRYSQMRAIENRRWLVRSANTGISCVISPSGKILHALPYGETGAFAAKVQLLDQNTFYTQNGNVIGRIAVFLSIIILMYLVVSVIVRS